MHRSTSKAASVVILSLILSLFFVLPVFADSDTDQAVEVPSVDALNDTLNSGAANGGTIKLASGGTWNVDSTIKIPGGFTVDLNGQTVTSSVQYAFALNGDGASIKNGTINKGGVNVSAADPTGSISGLRITNAPEYGIRLYSTTLGSITGNTITNPTSSGINIHSSTLKGSISGNTISGCKASSYGSLNIMSGSTISGAIDGNTIKDAKGMGIYMYSKCKSGAITNNTISGCADHALRMVGSSSASSNDGSVAGDIAYNAITSCRGHGISLYNGSHCGKITHNKLKNIGGASSTGDFAIIVNAGSCFKTYASEVTYNEIDGVTMAGIVAFSGPFGQSTKKYQDYGYIAGDIAYNTVSNNATAKRNVNWKNPKKNDPVCEGAIYVDCHARVFGSIHDNTINTSYDDGINVLAYSKVTSIYNNKINNCSNSGISVKSDSSVGSINKNVITSPKRYGVFINSNSKVTGTVNSNTIKNPGETGLAVLQKSSVKSFSGNKVTGAKLYGVLAGGSGSEISLVSKNTITVNNKKEGYPVFCNTKCRITKITGNNLSGKYSAGIRVKQPSGKIWILSNKLVSKTPKTAKSMGMSIDGCKNKVITIKSNNITGNGKGPGIYIKTSKSVIKKNKFKKVTKKISK